MPTQSKKDRTDFIFAMEPMSELWPEFIACRHGPIVDEPGAGSTQDRILYLDELEYFRAYTARDSNNEILWIATFTITIIPNQAKRAYRFSNDVAPTWDAQSPEHEVLMKEFEEYVYSDLIADGIGILTIPEVYDLRTLVH